MATTSNQRRHDIDALRALAFALLIVYHVGMFYVSWDWHVKSAYPAPWLETIMSIVNQWRMPLIFLISGLAVNFLLESRLNYGQFAWQRSKRLLWPLLFAMLVIVPPQAYYEALSNGAVESGYLSFLGRYLTLQTWPDGAFAGADYGVTWMHLWYLPYLWFYTLLVIPLAGWVNGPGAGLRRWFQSLRGIWLILVPVLWLLPIGTFVFPAFPYIRHDLITDWYAHAMFGSFFAFGFLIGRTPGLWQELARLRWWTLALAPLSFAAYRWMTTLAPEQPTMLVTAGQSLIVFLNRWIWIALMLGWGHQLLNRPMAWLDYANRAVYPWYILHQTVTVVTGYHLSALALGPVVEPLLLIAVTIGGCAAGMYLVEHWLPWLRPALGLKPARGQLENNRAARVGGSG